MITTLKMVFLLSCLFLENSAFVDDNEVYPLDVPERIKFVILKRVFVPKRDLRPYNIPYEEEEVKSRRRRSVKKNDGVLSLDKVLEINKIGRETALETEDDMVAAEDIPFMPLFTYRAKQLRRLKQSQAWRDKKKIW